MWLLVILNFTKENNVYEGKWNNLNFFSNGLLLQCCLCLWFITHVLYNTLRVLFPYALCVCLLIIQGHSKWKLLFYCNFSMPQIAGMSVGVSPQFWWVNVTNKCILQNEDHVGWCVHLKIVLTESTSWHQSLSRTPRFVKSQIDTLILHILWHNSYSVHNLAHKKQWFSIL